MQYQYEPGYSNQLSGPHYRMFKEAGARYTEENARHS